MKAGQVINDARDLHSVLSVTNYPVPLALRELSREERTITSIILTRVPGALAEVLVTPLPLADFNAGIDLATAIPGGWFDLPVGEFTTSVTPSPNTTFTAKFIPWEQKNMWHSGPAFTFRNGVIYFLGVAQNYARYATFRLTYTPAPAQLLTENSDINLPDDALDALSLRVAAFGLQRLVGNPNFKVTKDIVAEYKQDALEARTAYVKSVFMSLAGHQSYEMHRVDDEFGDYE